jgi:hypothetical protein
MSAVRKYFFILFLIGLSSVAYGQAASSPFSTFGMGEPYTNALIQNQGMGGIGVSQPQFWYINNQNPALLVNNYYTTFQTGAIVESRTAKADTSSQKSVGGNLNYLVIAFPVKPGRWTTSLGLMPLTRVNYKLQYVEQVLENGTNNVIDTANVYETGQGGLSQFYWSNGVRLHQNWSIGLKASYVFGSKNTDYSNYIISPDLTTLFVAGIKEQAYVKDFTFSGGLSFSQDSLWNKGYRLSVGAVYNFAADLNTDKTTFIQRRLTTGTPITSDTVVQEGGSIHLPSSYTLGVSLGKESKWSVGAEFFVQDWSKFKSLTEGDGGLKKSWRASLGGEFAPDIYDTKNYLKRITYRAGLSYELVPFSANNNQLKDFGINFGLSMPAGRSSLDWAFRMGKRGDKSETVLEEKYFRIYFGITFNDLWFIKHKFD